MSSARSICSHRDDRLRRFRPAWPHRGRFSSTSAPADRLRGEQPLDHVEGGIHQPRAQPRATIEDVVERTILTNKVDAARSAVEAALTHEDGDDADFAGRHADLGKRDLGAFGEAVEVREPIGHIGGTLKNPVVGEVHIAPRLGIDDDDARGADHDEVDVGVTRTGPEAVAQDVETLLLERVEQVREASLRVRRCSRIGDASRGRSSPRTSPARPRV